MADIPKDPFGPMAEAAVGARELFLSFVRAEFTESQALYLTAQLIIGSHQGRGSGDES